MREELAEAGRNFSSEDMAIVLLSHIWLLPKYSGFYTSLLTSGRTTPMTWDELVPMVLAHDDQHQLMKKGGLDALTGQFNKKKAKGKEKATDSLKFQDKGEDKAPKKERICYECGKSGHFKRDCPDKDKSRDDSDKTAVAARSGAFVHLKRL